VKSKESSLRTKVLTWLIYVSFGWPDPTGLRASVQSLGSVEGGRGWRKDPSGWMHGEENCWEFGYRVARIFEEPTRQPKCVRMRRVTFAKGVSRDLSRGLRPNSPEPDFLLRNRQDYFRMRRHSGANGSRCMTLVICRQRRHQNIGGMHNIVGSSYGGA
jgi:hypothetical protein